MTNKTTELTQKEIDLIQIAYANGITSPKELARFMGQCEVESGSFYNLQEGFRYTNVDNFQKTFSSTFKNYDQTDIESARKAALEGKPEALANMVYGPHRNMGHSGDDGWRYSGKGYIQLTWKSNYEEFNKTEMAKATGIDFVKNPEMLRDPEYGALAAVHYWQKHIQVLGKPEDLTITRITGAINSSLLHLEERKTATTKWENLLTPERLQDIIDNKEPVKEEIYRSGINGSVIEDIQKQMVMLELLQQKDVDGYYGKGLTSATKAFQEKYELPVTGNVNEATKAKLDELAPLRDKVLQTEQQITAKLDDIDKLNDQLKDYDPIRDIGEIAKVDADIEQACNDIAQLEMSKNGHIDQAIARKEAEIETLKGSIATLKVDNPVTTVDESASTGAIPSKEAALNLQITSLEKDINTLEDRRDSIYEQRADSLKEKNGELQEAINDYDKNHIDPLTTLQTKIDNDSNTTFDSIKDDLKTTGIQVITPSGLTAEEFASINLLNPKNGDEAKAAQQYLYDQGAFGDKAHADAVDSAWGSGSRTAVQQLLYNQGHFPEGTVEKDVVTESGTFGPKSKAALEAFNDKQNTYLADLTAEDLNKLVADEKADRLEQKPEILKSMQEAINTNNEYQADLEKAANELSIRQMALLDKEIAKRDEVIGRYDNALTKLNPETLEANSKNAYDLVKDDLAKSKELSPLLSTSETKLIELSSLDPTNKEDVKALQQFFCDRGLLTADEVKGSYGSKTQGLVKDALGEDRATTFDAGAKLSLDDLTKISEKRLNELSAAELSDKISALKLPLEAEKNELVQLREKQTEVPGVEKTAQVGQPENTRLTVSSGDPDIDRILQATLNGNHEEVIRLTREMVQRPDMQELNQNLLAEARQTKDLIREQQQLEQQEIARQQELQQAQQAQ